MFNCQQTFDRMQDYLDRELSSEEMEMVRMHLDACGVCAEEYVFEESVIRFVRSGVSDCCMPTGLASMISRSLDSA